MCNKSVRLANLLAYHCHIHTVKQTPTLPFHPTLSSHIQLSTQCAGPSVKPAEPGTSHTTAYVCWQSVLLGSRINAGDLFSLHVPAGRILIIDSQIIEILQKADRLIACIEDRGVSASSGKELVHKTAYA